MLYFHKNTDKLGDDIKDFLQNISAAHKIVDIQDQESHLVLDGKPIIGEQAVFRYLDSLKSILENEHVLSADACIVRPSGDGKVC
ncbi:hypothetical protein [Reichenbachiella versicolor]|uniref:hypothetical protein n=1 Tax=Reichenbachiella versicolor TaxID=1821036 RepID=UPI000D6E6B50|nr:hypothetical protein [Reichenbachiella versicolor]